MTINGEAANPIAGFWSSGPQQVTFLRLPPAGSGMNPFTFQSFVAGPSGGAGNASNSFAWTAIHP
jgi:hypothetical protein